MTPETGLLLFVLLLLVVTLGIVVRIYTHLPPSYGRVLDDIWGRLDDLNLRLASILNKVSEPPKTDDSTKALVDTNRALLATLAGLVTKNERAGLAAFAGLAKPYSPPPPPPIPGQEPPTPSGGTPVDAVENRGGVEVRASFDQR